MENSPYFDTITANRSIEQYGEDPDSSLEGTQLISAETVLTDEQGISTYIHTHFEEFLKHLQKMDTVSQNLLLAYYVLGKPQTQLAPLFGTTQTMCSFSIRAAVRALTAVIMFGGGRPSKEIMCRILTEAGCEVWLEGPNKGFGLSDLLEEFVLTRNYGSVAKKFGVHRPDIPRALRIVTNRLRESREREQAALGWYIESLINRASRTGGGLGRHQARKFEDMSFETSDVLGKFVLQNPTQGEIDQIFASRANNLRLSR